jgi:hypothetical protein
MPWWWEAESKREKLMPTPIDAEIKRRGGVVRWRTHKSKSGKLFRVAVVRKPGPRGGRTISYPME